MTIRHEGFVLVGRKNDEYYFVDSVFDYGDGFHGATGSIVRPVFSEEYEEASDRENVAERYCEHYETTVTCDTECKECEGYPDRDKGCESCGVEGLDAWIDDLLTYENISDLIFDPSDGCRASDCFNKMGIEHECTDYSGGGRIFDGKMGFDTVYDNAVLNTILDVESGAVSAEDAAKVIFG